MTGPFRNLRNDDYATTQVLWLSNPRLDPFLNLFCNQALSSNVFCRIPQHNVCPWKLLPVDVHADNAGICDVWMCDQEAFQFCRWHLESLQSQI